MLDSFSGWGVNGSLVTLLPDMPLPQQAPPPNLHQAASSSTASALSAGAVAGIVVGSVFGAALLVGAAMLLLIHRCECMLVCVLGAAAADTQV